MSAISAGNRPTPSQRMLDRILARRLAVNWVLVAYFVIFAVAFALRFWDLGARALHHDESIHAKWSWDLAQGDYHHSPIFHGPLYYHAQGLVFLIAGASDYTSRVSAAIFGMGIVAMPLLLKRWLGTPGTIAAMAFLALSPTIVYYSRFIREDVYMAFFTILMVAAMWQYFATRKDRWLIVLALAYAGSHATKEATYLTAAVFLIFLDLYVAIDLARQRARALGDERQSTIFLWTVAYAPFAWAIVSLWPLLKSLRRSQGWAAQMSPQGDALIIMGTLTVPLITRAILDVPLVGRAFQNNELAWDQVCTFARTPATGGDAAVLGGLFAISISGAALVGLNWRPRTWLIAAGGAAAIFLLLFTSFGTNLSGACTGAWGGLDYWLSQHDVRRGNQPWFYYMMLMPAYEFLALALALFGSYWAIFRGSAFSRFLVLWIVGVFLTLSWAGEKMPWLNTHIALPVALLAGWTVTQAWQRWDNRPDRNATIIALASAAAIALGTVAVLAFLPGGAVANVLRLVVLVGGVAIIAFAASQYGRRAAGVFAVTAIIGGLGLFSVWTMLQVTFERGDVPKDLLIYTQSGPEITDIADEIDRVAMATGRGLDMRIAVDSYQSLTWPWAWYLRDYRNVSYTDMENGPPSGDYDMIIVNRGHIGAVTQWMADNNVTRYGAPVEYQHRIHFPEDYKNALSTGPFEPATWGEIVTKVFNGDWSSTWANFWLYHDPDNFIPHSADTDARCKSCGSVDGVVFFPAMYDTETGKITLSGIEPPAPGQDDAGRLTIGGFGNQPGQFISPVDVETDAAGNVYIVDEAGARVQKFDAEGNYLTGVNLRDDGSASTPWGIEIGPDGTVVVADTFGWTLRVHNADLQGLSTIGVAPGGESPPGDFELFGPRDAAIDASGQVWVTDTGHDRIQVYGLDGSFVMSVGSAGSGEGQFDEPVGIDIGPDGTIAVADMYNARVVLLNPDGSFASTFPVDGWGGQEVENKPYLTYLSDGRIAVSLPLLGQVRVYSPDGTLAATITDTEGAPLNRPYGIAEAVDGRLWIVEGGAQRARLFEIPAP